MGKVYCMYYCLFIEIWDHQEWNHENQARFLLHSFGNFLVPIPDPANWLACFLIVGSTVLRTFLELTVISWTFLQSSHNGKTAFVKVHAPWKVLTRMAEEMLMKMPIKVCRRIVLAH